MPDPSNPAPAPAASADRALGSSAPQHLADEEDPSTPLSGAVPPAAPANVESPRARGRGRSPGTLERLQRSSGTDREHAERNRTPDRGGRGRAAAAASSHRGTNAAAASSSGLLNAGGRYELLGEFGGKIYHVIDDIIFIIDVDDTGFPTKWLLNMGKQGTVEIAGLGVAGKVEESAEAEPSVSVDIGMAAWILGAR